MSTEQVTLFTHLRFMLELWVCITAFILPLQKKKHLRLTCALGFWGMCALSFVGLPFSAELILYFLGEALLVWLLCDITPQNAVYCTACGYAVQHFCYTLRNILYSLFHLPYGATQQPIGWQMLGIALILLCSAAAYFFMARRIAENGTYELGLRQSLTSTLIVILLVQVFSVAASRAYKTGMEQLYLMCNLYDAFCCLFFLWNQTSWFERSKMQRELTFQHLLREQQTEQYKLTRENIDIINRKCHDLKHQLTALQTVVPEDQRNAYRKEVETAIQIYDSSLDTGNEVLDTILTDKSLYCEAQHINMTCVADGRCLSFMDSMDIYAIFGNALDNAIRAVLTLEDAEKRVIAVSVWQKNGLVLFQFENYYEGLLTFEGSKPRTTKGAEDYHGFGIKSIQQTAKKYGGQMTLHTENNLFLLRVSIPVPTEKA